MATISGILKNASGVRPNTKIILTAYKTTSYVVTLAPDTTIITDANGAYSFVCNPSFYNVRIQQPGYPCENVGIIQVYSDSVDGTINDFLTNLKPDDLTPEIVKEVLQYRNEAIAAATEAKESEINAKSSSDSALASKNEIEVWYDYFALNYPKFATDYADFESKYPDFIVKYNETVTNAFNANKDAESAASSNAEAQHWAEEAEKRAQQIFVSGGVFDPSTGPEYPDATGVLRDTAYIVSMPERDKYFTFTSGDLTGKSTANGDVMLYDTPSNKWALVESGVESALTKAVADTLYDSKGSADAFYLKVRTDSASQLGGVYQKDYEVGDVIPSDAMTNKLMYWYNGQFYSVGTDTRFTSVDFDADLSSGRFVSANLTTQVQQWRDVGCVKGWLNQHDDTLMIDAALSSGNGYIKLEAGRIYNVDGGVLYTRKWQVLDLNGATIRLKDNATNRKTVLEQDDYSQIINGTVDGNWQSNNSGSQTWRKDGRLHVDLSPESHGIAQRRYDTNNNVIRNAKGAFIDQVKIHDTLRSNILSCGSSSIGTAELENSYCDHQLYISGNGTSGQFGGHFEHVKIRGFCNSDALSVSSTGESTGLSFGKVSLRDITMTPWRSDSTLDTDKYGSRWIECRENTSGTVLRSTITFDSIDINDTRTELDLLYDNARKCRFRDWHVSIDSLTIRTQLCPASAVTADFQVLDVRNETTSVSIQNFHFEIDSPTPLSAEMAVVYAQNCSVINIGVLTGKMIAEGITTAPRWIMNVDSTITVGSIGLIQNKGTVLWNRSVNYQSKITIGSDNGVSGYTEAIVNTSDNAAINPVINNVTGRSITLEGGDITNKPISGFLVGAIDLGLASGVVGDIDNAYVGQKVEIIWNGVCKKSGGNIRWLNKIEPAETPTIGSFSILRYSKHNGMWIESSFVPF